MDNPNLIGKKVLITNHFIVNFTGSELATFDIALEFKKLGCEVTIATFSYDSPLKELFENENIKVVNILKSNLDNTEYDIIWSHHSPVLSHCIFESNVTAKKVIFSSLSPYEPLEAPPVYINELSLCLANSFETRDQLINEGVVKDKIHVLNNSVDDSFFDKYVENRSKQLNRVCIISNHVPEEIKELSKLFTEVGIDCDIFGIQHRFEHITPDKLENYDVIITIGRSVQYGLAMGIPVYCYDRFGGPGYITTDNIDSAEYFNFAGRCTNRALKENEIFDEITVNYSSVFDQRFELHLKSKDRYKLKNNILKILSFASTGTIDLTLIKKKFFINKRINKYYEQELQIEEIKSNNLQQKQKEILDLNNELKSIYGSRGWKMLNIYYRIKHNILGM